MGVAQDLIPRLDIDAAGAGEAKSAGNDAVLLFCAGIAGNIFCTACLKSLIFTSSTDKPPIMAQKN